MFILSLLVLVINISDMMIYHIINKHECSSPWSNVFVFRLRDRSEVADGIPLVMRDTIAFLKQHGKRWNIYIHVEPAAMSAYVQSHL